MTVITHGIYRKRITFYLSLDIKIKFARSTAAAKVIAGSYGNDPHLGILHTSRTIKHLGYRAVTAASVKATVLTEKFAAVGALAQNKLRSVPHFLGNMYVVLNTKTSALGTQPFYERLYLSALTRRGIENKNMLQNEFSLPCRVPSIVIFGERIARQSNVTYRYCLLIILL